MEKDRNQAPEVNQVLEQQDKPLSKNKQRKLRKYQKKLETRPLRRAQEKLKRKEFKQNQDQSDIRHRRFRGNDEKLEANKRLEQSLISGPKVVIDCQYEHSMTLKEKKRFAQQIRRSYSSNRVAESPLHLYLSSLSESSEFYQVCCSQNEGFGKYVVDRSEKNVWDLFDPVQKIVYLTPDSEAELESFSSDCVYVIGGIVDETTNKRLSLKVAKSKNITTAKLPIDKYFTRADSGTFKQELAINQVIDIILKWHETKDWVEALGVGLPKRTGFVPKQVEENADSTV